MRYLITAGPTHEPIDDVRFLGNYSSGRMGFALAAAAVASGHEVVLVHGPVCLEPPPGLHELVSIQSAAELHEATVGRFDGADITVMAAAVADFTPRRRLAGKHERKGDGLKLELVSTEDTCAALGRRRRTDQLLVGFALEPSDPEHERALGKLRRKGCNLLVANRPSNLGSEAGEVTLLDGDGVVWGMQGTKAELATRLTATFDEACQALWSAAPGEKPAGEEHAGEKPCV